MSELVAAAATAAAVAALVLSALVLAATRRPSAVLLDLLLVAGLLRLTSGTSWTALGAVVLVVLVRRLARAGIVAASRSRQPPAPAPA
ncbi:hypothetical protein [uncultured Pseudokineococcus sp.]|uniref:hypothetical protein n=1 Tax=uncultured Pseudokineococcus sp. TaxID=1642928 RepID=UPI0026327AEB|nr:hypothetical protein [uncultured Pseudokineococcus sp.]